MKDLTNISTQDLIKELSKRNTSFGYCIVVSHKHGVDVFGSATEEDALQDLKEWIELYLDELIRAEDREAIENLLMKNEIRQAANVYFDVHHDDFLEYIGPIMRRE